MYNSQYYTCEQIDQRLLQGYLDDYNAQTGQSLTKAQFLTKLGNIFSKEGVIDNIATQIGYYECDTAAGTAAKVITVANYALFAGGSMKVKFANKNTANNATLNINSQGAKALYYQGERASATNSWDAEEVVEIYYDGTSYYANNVKGGSGSGVYDVSKEHPTSGPNSDGKFTLEYILNPSNVNELIPVNRRYPGMSIQFVSTSDNKYVQYRLKTEWSVNPSNWECTCEQYIGFYEFLGANNTIQEWRCINAMKGHAYMIQFPETPWATSSVSSSNRKLDLYYENSEGNETNIEYWTSSTPPKDFTFTLPDNVDVSQIIVRLRANAGVKVRMALVDITPFNGRVTALESDSKVLMLDNARTIARKTELNYDASERKTIDADGSLTNSSSYNTYWYIVDSTYDYIITNAHGVPSGRHIAFYNSTTPSAESKISIYTGYDAVIKLPIPEGTQLIVVCFPSQNTSPYLPTYDLKVAVGLSDSCFGKFIRDIDNINQDIDDTNNKVTKNSYKLIGANNTNRYITPIKTVKGRRYRITRDKVSWNVTGIASSTRVFEFGYYVGSTFTRLDDKTAGSSYVIPEPLEFTAVECDYYQIMIKATSGEEVNWTITDITDIVPITGVGSTSLITLSGGKNYIDGIFTNLHVSANPLVLLYFSDIHNGLNAIGQIVDFKKTFTAIDDVLCGGDNVADQPNDAYPFFNASVDAAAKQILTVVGNHDVYDGQTKLTSKQVFDIYYGEHTTYWSGVTFPANYQTEGLCYWYKDYSSQGIRLIGLDCINWTNAEGSWLADVLADAITNQLHVIICLHYKPNQNFTGIRTCTFDSLLAMSGQYADPSICQIVQTAINNGLKFVCYLFGHEHKDYFGNISGYENQYAIAVSKPWPVSDDESRPWKTDNKDYYCFNLVSVNKAEGILSIIRIGNNRDKFERYKNRLAFDYINHVVVGNS